ncbi:MAG: inosine/xanthosine triphosphatase [Anaerolineae bacterium]|jgi:inosine/xanthosine triphosphatase|nr:inosine/xanthosine triphosphatase [Anaerolineae bacterium]
MLIAIGSTNPVKYNAAQAVLVPMYPDIEFICVDVPSGVASQPWGNKATRTGALNRARAALAQTGADLAIGLEGGVQESEFGLMTCAWCVLVDTHGQIGVGGNSSILLPKAVANRLRQGEELGAAMDQLVNEHNTKWRNGAIGILTGDLETRQSAYESILRLALAPFQNPAWYPVSE